MLVRDSKQKKITDGIDSDGSSMLPAIPVNTGVNNPDPGVG